MRGIALAFLSTIAFSSGMAVVRHLSAELHPFQIAFFSAFFGMLTMLVLVPRFGLRSFRTNHFMLQLARGALSVVGILAVYYALSVTPLATVTALNFTMPIFTTVLAVLLLKERVDIAKWSAILFGFAGVFVIVRPGIVEVNTGALLVIVGSILFAIVILVMKVLTRTDSIASITLYGAMLRAPLALVPALFVWQWPDARQLMWLAAMGSIGTLSSFAFAQALKEVETNVISPMFFLQLIWAAAIGYLVFAEIPSVFTWLGGAMILSSVTYMAYRESRVAKTAEA
jgi:drug/metabolite transporter (DMT)-like permease